jgi:predicted CopG family antitoxin
MTSKYNKKLKQIAIDEQNYDTLRMLGHTRDSFNDVLTRLLQQNVKVLQSGQQVGAHGQTAASKAVPTPA